MGNQIMGFERSSDGEMFWFLTDQLSSVRDIVRGSDGAVLQSYDYTENGEKTVSLDGGISNSKTWVGGLSVQDETADTDLYLMGHRWYSASAGGRFLSRDPIGFDGGMNLYSYGNSPVTTVEPEGLDDRSTWLQDVAGWVGSVFHKESSNRVGYLKAVSRPGVTSSERAALRAATQETQTQLGKIVTEWLYNRPGRAAKRAARQSGQSAGNPGKSNPLVNASAWGMRAGSWALIGYGCSQSYEYISESDDKAKAVTEEGFGWTGAIGGGALGSALTLAVAGSPGGPGGVVAGFLGGLVGSVVGGASGRAYGAAIYDGFITNPPPGNFVVPY